MTIDHIGYFLFPEIKIFRIIGRLAFPLFLYLSHEAYLHTSNRRKYAERLFYLGVITQLVTMAFTKNNDSNAFITLAVCFMMVWMLDEKQYLWAVIIVLAGLAVNMQFGLYGVLLMAAFHFLKDDWGKICLCWLILNFVFCRFTRFSNSQYFSIVAAALLMMYNGQAGCRKYKYWFYVYYPLHVVILYFIKVLLHD